MTTERERLAKAICYGLGCRCRMPRCQGEDACVGAADSRNLEAAAFVEAAGFRAPTASEDDMKAARQICEDLSFRYDEESVATVAAALAAARAEARREAIKEIAHGQHPEWEMRAVEAEKRLEEMGAAIRAQEKTTNDWREAWDDASREAEELYREIIECGRWGGNISKPNEYIFNRSAYDRLRKKALAALASEARDG